MNDKTFGQLLKNDSKSTAVKVGWDELLKIVQVGDTVKQHGHTFQVGKKEFVEDMEGQYEIKVFILTK
jgi:hypothetical protein